MIVIDINNLTVAFGEKEILSGVTLAIPKGECIGLTGLNGAGKTTLMKVLVGMYEPTAGTVSMVKGLKIGYLAQQHVFPDSAVTVYEQAKMTFDPLFRAEEKLHELEEAMAASDADMADLGEKYQSVQNRFEALGGYGWKSRLQGVLKGLGLGESFWDKPVGALSGGERTRLALASLLLEENDVLLLDEPTNHLDLAAAQWLTDFLARFSGTILLISHDRYMMDKLCAGVAQIESGKLHFYRGNYTDYCRKWEEECRANQKAYDQQQDEIRRQRAIIARYRQFNREKSIRAAESREKVLDRMELLDAPEQHAELRLSFPMDRVSGGDVLYIRDLSKRFGERVILENFTADVKQGQRIAIIGPNGAGKTTLMELLLGRMRPDRGEVRRGVNVDMGYYEQGQRQFMGTDSVMDMVWLGNRDLTQTEVRSRCAAMLFFGEDVFKPGTVLSGGERARCALAQLSVSGCNTLLLDEPTNHLDMDSREVLEDALERFEGTLIAVSHDRYFINRIADTLWVYENGTIRVFKGSYDEYLASQKAPENAPEEQKPVNKTQAAKDRAKERESREEEKKRKLRVKELEKTVEELEEKKAAFEELFASAEIYQQPEKLLQAQNEYQAVQKALDQAMEEWMEADV